MLACSSGDETAITTKKPSGQDETMTATLSDHQVVRAPGIENRTMIILYGSETGNAEEIAMALGRMTERLHFQTRVDEMDNFKLVLDKF